MPDVDLDTRSLLCPMPVLKTKKAIDSMQPGQLLAVNANDGMAKSDILQLAQRLKVELIDIADDKGSVRITIRK